MTTSRALPERPAVEQRLALFADHRDRVAFSVDNPCGCVDWTYRDLVDRTYREAHRLDELGVTRGDVVAILTGDDPISFVLRWAANVVGAAAVVVPDGLAAPALAEILATCRAGYLEVDAQRHDLAAIALHELDGNAAAVLIDVDAVAAPSDASAVPVRIQPDDLAWIRLTGGSTGVPKGVPRKASFMGGLTETALAGWRDATQLLCTPVAHLAGTLSDIVLAAGGRVVLQSPFDPGHVLAAIARERVTWISLMPRLLHQLLDHPNLAHTDTSSLRSITLGSAPVSAHRLTQAIDRFGPVLSVGYGTLEVTQITTLSAEELRRPELRSTVGRPFHGVEVTVHDDRGAEVPTGATGEVWVRSHAVMPGYVGAPDQTAAVLRDGWFRTGDLGHIDDQGYLTLVGRAGEVIFAEHARVHPTEVEDALLRHPDVTAAGVFGVADGDGTESVAAAVVARAGTTLQADDLIRWVAQQRGPNVAPDHVVFVDGLPTTPSGKVDRAALRLGIDGSASAQP